MYQLVQNFYMHEKGEENLICYWDDNAWDYFEIIELRWNTHRLLTLGWQRVDLIFESVDDYNCFAVACNLEYLENNDGIQSDSLQHSRSDKCVTSSADNYEDIA